MNVVLTGFMGTGKTTVGKELSGRLGYGFLDTDARVEQESGRTISEIFADSGEGVFREMEARVIQIAAALDRYVIATGGGAVLRADNMRALERNGVVICLSATPEAIRQRLQFHSDRPLLREPSPDDTIRRLLGERAIAYGRCHLALDTSSRTITEVVDEIQQFLKFRGRPAVAGTPPVPA